MNNKIKARLDQNYQEGKRVHEDNLSSTALVKRIADNKRMQDEKDHLYDMENSEKVTFTWD